MKHTKEERQAYMSKMRKLAKTIGNMSEEERQAIADKCFISTCEGHPLSLFNNVFLSYQANGTPLTIVGGFRQWQRQGRQVIKGQHAAGSIYVPMNGRKKDEDTGDEDEDEKTRLTFRLVPVFDVSQTEEI